MRARPLLTALLAVVAVAASADGGAVCYTTSTPTMVQPDPLGGGDYYVDVDPCLIDPAYTTCFTSIWIYQESNGIAGQQRGDEVVNDFAHCAEREGPPGLLGFPTHGYDDGNGHLVFPDADVF